MFFLLIRRRLLHFSYLLFTLFCAFFTVQILRLHLTEKLTVGTIVLPIQSNRSSPDSNRTLKDYETILDRNLFNSASRGVPGGLRAPFAPDLTLVGTVAGPPFLSLALIADRTEGNRITICRWGDRIGTYQIVKILRREVHVSKDGKSIEKLLISEDPPGGPTAIFQVPAPERGFQKTGRDETFLERDFVNDLMKNPTRLMKELRLRPVVQDGRINGVKLLGAKEQGLVTRLGFQNEDIIRRINGEEIQGLEFLPDLLMNMISGKPVTIDLERQGRKKTLHFQIG